MLAAVAFLGAVGCELWILATHPERRWYDGRALAESAKTLAWRYAVGADPYPVTSAEADEQLLEQLRSLSRDAPETGIEPDSRPAVSDAMAALRRSTLLERKKVYLQHRIGDQREWYSGKSRQNGRRPRRWQSTLVVIELAGVVLAFLRGYNPLRGSSSEFGRCGARRRLCMDRGETIPVPGTCLRVR
jgi:hypothetical protein